MTRISAPDLNELQVFALSLALQPHLCRNERRRFYSQMRRALRRMDLLLCHSAGLCLVIQLGLRTVFDFRQVVLGWLIDQQETHTAVLNALRPVRDLTGNDAEFIGDDDAPLPPALLRAIQAHVRQMLTGMLDRRATELAVTLGLELP